MTTPSNGFVVIGAIEAKWLATGGEHGVLGVALGSEQPAPAGSDSRGRMQHFAGGVVAGHPDIGEAHEVHGAIATRWDALGRAKFGFPTTDESTPPDRAGRFNHFRAVHLTPTMDLSIYWHDGIGAHEIYGWIRNKWAALGW